MITTRDHRGSHGTCRVPLVAVFLAVLGVVVASPTAYAWGPYDRHSWSLSDADVPVYYDDNFPMTAARKARIAAGANAWNDLNRQMYFMVRPRTVTSSVETRDGDYGNCPTPVAEGRRVSVLHWGGLDGFPGGTVGAVSWCRKPNDRSRLVSARLFFDKGEGWYFGTQNSTLRNRSTGEIDRRVDFWSVVTHEFGHMTGWYGHFDRDSDRCRFLGQPAVRTQTMCPIGRRGYERWRTLGAYDKYEFMKQYPGF